MNWARCDALGNVDTLTLPDQRQLNHLYYGSGHLHQLNLNGRVISDFERDALQDEVLRTRAPCTITAIFSHPRKIAPTPSQNTSDGPI
ncbi:hypothetical protein [Pseudomonas carnis]|uniref:hypothetical protein n=1 Tax=Pseudomonas TaxID=286 RepID=UPI001CA7A8AB|nr:hypothetical protein [Pseudomonas carnis]MCF5692457.1 hypothetical protein [Pseudomonas sp. PA-1-8C]MCF5787618.1 hypothetical protein [Pseudomonas sp. PA-1-6G]MCF5795338.1 hypothetical protein [Pseudomonas sp. PA-1-6B]MCF5800568.1 hypothetical protein [Pseudomonas sp. PA-1-5A]MCF5837075.1 hypothetical protein [Pseudomonas sp. PA-1-6A]